VFIEAKDDGGGGDNWTTGAVTCTKLQSNQHHQQTNTQFFTGQMPFLSPNQQCESTEGKNIIVHGHAHPKLIWGSSNLSLTTNSSWLPWGRGLPCLSSALLCQYPKVESLYGIILCGSPKGLQRRTYRGLLKQDFLRAICPVLSPNEHCQSTEGVWSVWYD